LALYWDNRQQIHKERILMHDQHTMQLETTHPSGAEEWFCPTCERRFLMQWPPEYKKIILVPGDEQVVHTGGKGGLHVGAAEVTPDDPALTDGLRPWLKGLANTNLD